MGRLLASVLCPVPCWSPCPQASRLLFVCLGISMALGDPPYFGEADIGWRKCLISKL